MTFELGAYTFGNTSRTANGNYGPTAQAIRDVLEAVHVAEEVGLDLFGFGEHHTRSMPLSSPTSLVNAVAAFTHDIKLGTGGSPSSVLRAGELGLPMFLGILGGTPEHRAQYGHAYREAWDQAGHPAEGADVAVAVHGFVGEKDRDAKPTYLEHELRMFQTGAAEIGRPGLSVVVGMTD